MRTLAGPHTLYDRGGDEMEDQGVKSQTIVVRILTGLGNSRFLLPCGRKFC